MWRAKDWFLRRNAAGAAMAGSAVALAFWERRRPDVPQTGPDRVTAEELIRTGGTDLLAYCALRQDRNWFFSPSRNSFLAYTNVGHLAYVSGDPVGDRTEFPKLIEDFRNFSRQRGQHLIFMMATEQAQPMYQAAGLKSIYIGEDAVVDPQTFSLAGSKNRKIRQAVNHVKRAGYTVDIVHPGSVDDATRAQMREISVESRGNQPERGFSGTMDGMFRYPDTYIAIARDDKGKVGGFVQLLELPATNGFTMPSRRRRADAPNGLDEFMIAESLEWAKQRGAEEMLINFASLGRYLKGQSAPIQWGVSQIERVVPMRRLQTFANKFSPQWQPRYVCFERYMDLPPALLACTRLEGFMPTPLKRATPDLAAG